MTSLTKLGESFGDTALRVEPCKTLATCTAGPEGCRVIEIPRPMWRAAHAMEAVKALNDLPHFRQLPTAILQNLAADMTLRKIPYRGLVAKEGAPAIHLFLIKSGQVKTERVELLEDFPENLLSVGQAPTMQHERRKPRRRQREMMVLGPGNSFEERIEATGKQGEPMVYPCSLVAASENVVVWELRRSSLERLHKAEGKGRDLQHFNTSKVYAAQAAAAVQVEERAVKASAPIKSMMALPELPVPDQEDLGWKLSLGALQNFRGLPRPESVLLSDVKLDKVPFQGQFPRVREAPANLALMPPHKQVAALEAALPEVEEEVVPQIAFPVSKLVETSGKVVVPRPSLEHPLEGPNWQEVCGDDPLAMPTVFGGRLQRSLSKMGRDHQDKRASQMREIMRKLNPDLGFPFRNKHETYPAGSSGPGKKNAQDIGSIIPVETIASRRKFVTEWRSGGRLATSGRQTIVRMERDHSMTEEAKTQMERSLQANLDKICQKRNVGAFPDIKRSVSGLARPVFGGAGVRHTAATSRSASVASRYS